MPIENLINHIQARGHIDEKDIINLKNKFKIKNYGKNEIIIKKGQVCDKIFFVHSGLLRTYYDHSKTLEITRLIACENQFCTNISSFSNLSENNENIQSLEKSVVLFINHKDFFELISQSFNLSKIYYNITSEFNHYYTKRFEFLHTLSNIDKLIVFQKLEPKIYRRITNKILASFIGVSPENCSRLKKEILFGYK